MRSQWIRVGPNPRTGVLIKREKFEHKDTKGECHMKTEAEMERRSCKPTTTKVCLQPQKLEGSHGTGSPVESP